jgi:hypothetical protein
VRFGETLLAGGEMTMNRRDFHKILGAATIAPAGLASADAAIAAPAWSLAANIAEWL